MPQAERSAPVWSNQPDKSEFEVYTDRAQSTLAEARKLVKSTERTYKNEVVSPEANDPVELSGLFNEGDLIGYHRRNEEITFLEQELDGKVMPTPINKVMPSRTDVAGHTIPDKVTCDGSFGCEMQHTTTQKNWFKRVASLAKSFLRFLLRRL